MIAFLRRFFHRDQPDPAWHPTGYAVRYAGHDESKALAVFTAEQQQAEARRQQAKRTIQKLKARTR